MRNIAGVWEDIKPACVAYLDGMRFLYASRQQVAPRCYADYDKVYACQAWDDDGHPVAVISVENPKYTPALLPGILCHEAAHTVSKCEYSHSDSAHAIAKIWDDFVPACERATIADL